MHQSSAWRARIATRCACMAWSGEAHTEVDRILFLLSIAAPRSSMSRSLHQMLRVRGYVTPRVFE
jgi:hypothetical protein